VRASVRPFAYDTQGNRGVSFALNNIQLLRDGERLDSRVAPEEDFDAVEPVDLSDLEEAEDAAEDNGDSDPIDELLA
ncbi:MAG TPA: ssDNA-binding protein, partial [Gammaproteobacteria bacterium]|nr:ssDNA-binding protein [Gammaproteobacteria bacterium]